MDVLRGDVFQVDVVDLGADLDVLRHSGRGHQVVHRQGRVSPQLGGVGAFAHQLPAGGVEPPLGVDLPDPLDHLEEAGPAGDAVGFQRGGDGEADGLLRAAEIRHHQVGGHGIEAPLPALHGGVVGFQVDGDIRSLRFRHG